MVEPAASYHFHLPPELIAQDPPARREDSRLLRVTAGRGPGGEARFSDLPGLLRAGDLLVLNESRVLPARLLCRRTDTGGKVEILLIAPAAAPLAWSALARPVRRLRPGLQLEVLAGPGSPAAGEREPGPLLTVAAVGDAGEVEIVAGDDPAAIAERRGVMPLPPYIRRDPGLDGAADRAERDRRRYQTVFAQPDPAGAGSVAAPTAGLHFSPAVLEALAAAGVGVARIRLHVGPGTFRSPDEEQIRTRRLHPERFAMPAAVGKAVAETRGGGGRVIAVGTTSLRVLETVRRLGLDDEDRDVVECPASGGDLPPVFHGRAERRGGSWDVTGTTRLFIMPPDRIAAADGLLTNFHLPGSSLLMLVAALVGPAVWRGVYREAVERRMRFFSYGDCMLILPGGSDEP
ncbi:MAG: S-adenosylmethionine:tRNA ribosyltransferase-isomerase [Candidatus Krumholzibacteriia bacterium]